MKSEKDIFLKGEVSLDFDFYKIREKVASFAESEEGKEVLLLRESTSDFNTIDRLKKFGKEWMVLLESSFPSTLHSWPPIAEILHLLKVEGSSLSQEQLFALALFSFYTKEVIDEIKSSSSKISIPCLLEIAQNLPSLKEAEKLLFSVIDISSGEVKDIPPLREIRKRISDIKKEISLSLRKYTSDVSFNKILQSNVPALKGGRELIAVKSNYKNSVKGIIHEVSSSGQTVFIEPEEIVKANNDLIQEEATLQSEIRKIFASLSEKIRPFSNDFASCLDSLLLLDVTRAAAIYGKECKGIFCEDSFSLEDPPTLIASRHPLLGEKAVPVTVNFMPGKKVMIITGPNAGGKTVTLKTFALFALMNQAGFPLPADEGTRLPIFDSIFSVMGDGQSIIDSLSTFSGSMKKTALALNNATEKSLVLLDELGSGTDPLEGSAIAMAILDSLLERDSFVIATTHHGVLKNYGYANPKCFNASVEFESETLLPTYKLLLGLPGESHALDIALVSGLPEKTVAKAKSYIAGDRADVASLIKGLTEKHKELESLLEEAKKKEEDLNVKEHRLHEREAKLLEKEIELRETEHSESSVFLRETRSYLENLVREIREGEITREKTLGVRKFLDGLSEKVEEQSNIIEEKKDILQEELLSVIDEKDKITKNGIRLSSENGKRSSSLKKKKAHVSNKDALEKATAIRFSSKAKEHLKSRVSIFKEGDEVLFGKEKRHGFLIRKTKDDLWEVQFGSLKMKVSENQLIPIEEKSESLSKESLVLNGSSFSSETPVLELRLLGLRQEEALASLVHQLDLCAIHGTKSFAVIHGKGNGVLQKAVTDYLKKCNLVKDFHFSRPEAGGTGRTIVELL